MEFIKYMDFFGNKFYFYIYNQPNYQNIFGGIMSIIYCLLCIAIFFSFSIDELNHLNPISSISEFPFSEKKLVNIKQEKIWIPFRIVTDENKYIDHRDIMQISPYLIKGKFDYHRGMDLTYIELNYTLCNETSMVNSSEFYSLDISLNELYCIEAENITFGGGWNQDFTHYIEIGLYLCNGITYDESDPKCSGLIKLMENINSSLSFDFYYPVIQFQPANFENPISIIYKNYFYRLSAYSYKVEKLYIQEHILSDDTNLITGDINNKSFWGTSTFNGDSYSLSNLSDPLIKSDLNKVYTLEIYMDSGIVLYTRSYKKIYEIISDIFPILNLILYIFKRFTQYVKITFVKKKLSELIFEKKEIKHKKPLIKKIDSLNNNNIQHNNLKLDNNIQKKIFRKSGQLDNARIENKISLQNNYSNMPLNNENIINILNKRHMSTLGKRQQNDSSYKAINSKNHYKDNQLIGDKKKRKSIFPYKYYLLDFIYDKLIRPKSFLCISKIYFTVYNFMCQIYDISTHILLFKQLNFNNTILLEKIYKENGTLPSRPYHKININEQKIIDNIDRDLIGKRFIIYTQNVI